ncbi:hypothetical protein VOLCADRAFT_96817 [Volvox carteri f. nagariensis]|uniref:Uncharacterized protein n=1 Tax=Volvox carteri f. nagariensis TaxID=3068 RepID=D8UB51_VOLCA|nr:uncharacterized protein VOLCADRAFT_96817 [Volvox carteri f. nagariensis]EFJ43047.1 hypothetical protein VOLCADRAFT_96817 [Volvox carteri f. nagariensis]|eukprot:XP_002955846.1 hypothetical protein VOLCADRAFT_96817 [Volvox carteri f. nagariensis]
MPNDAQARRLSGICFEEEVLVHMRKHAVASFAVLDACRSPTQTRQVSAGGSSYLTCDVGWGSASAIVDYFNSGGSPDDLETRECGSEQPPSGNALRPGGAYVCWATSPYKAALVKSGYTGHLVKYLFDERLSVLEAVGKACGQVEAGGAQCPRAEMLGDIARAVAKPLVCIVDVLYMHDVRCTT